MKKLGFVIATTLFASSALADGIATALQPSVTVAVVEAGTALDWKTLESAPLEPAAQEQGEAFAEQAQQLNEKISHQVEQRLQEKLNRQFQLDF